MIVELVGVNGSGKTTMARELAGRLDVDLVSLGEGRDRHGRQLSKVRRAAGWLTGGLANPALAVGLLRRVSRERYIIRMALEVVRRDREVRRLAREGRSAVVDEGPGHALLRAWSLSNVDGHVGVVARRMAWPGITVLVDTPVEVALERLASDDVRDQALARVERNYDVEVMRRYVNAAGSVDVIRAVDVEQAAAAVAG